MLAIYLFIFTFSISISIIHRKTIVTPLVLFSFIWCILPAISTLGLLGLNKPSLKTHLYILISVFSFYWSYLCTGVVCFKSLKRNQSENGKTSIETDNFLNVKLIVISNILLMMILLPSAINSFKLAMTYGYSYVREIGTDALTSNVSLSIIYEFIGIQIMLASSCVVIGKQVSLISKEDKVMLILILINIILHSIAFAARALIVKVVFYILFAFFFCKNKSNKQKIYKGKSKIAMFIVITILMIFTVNMTYSRNTGNVASLSFFDTVIWYYVGPFSLFDLYITNPELSFLSTDTPLLFGTATFGFIYNIIPTVISALFGIDYFGTDYTLSVFTRLFMPVGRGLYMNSSTTAMYPFLRDFGLIGLIIGFSFMGFLIRKLENDCLVENTLRSRAIYIYVLYILFKTTLNYEPISPAITFGIFFIFIFTSKRIKKINYQ